ncbi:hypothetical protein ES705_44644 [subsurface metagenome]
MPVKPIMELRGVLSSWLIEAMNIDFRRSSSLRRMFTCSSSPVFPSSSEVLFLTSSSRCSWYFFSSSSAPIRSVISFSRVTTVSCSLLVMELNPRWRVAISSLEVAGSILVSRAPSSTCFSPFRVLDSLLEIMILKDKRITNEVIMMHKTDPIMNRLAIFCFS